MTLQMRIDKGRKTPFGFRFLLGRRWEIAAAWVGCFFASAFLGGILRADSLYAVMFAVYYFLIPFGVLGTFLMIDLVLEVLLYLDEDPDDLWDGEGR